MIINKTNIKALLGITVTTYDTQIDYIIPQLLDSICKYCKNDFILKGNNGHVYESCNLVITSTTITLTTTLPLVTGDFIRLYGTNYNDGLYQIKTYTGGVITIETTKTMRAETINAYIAIVDFPSIFINLISQYANNDIVNNSNIKIEEIDDTKIEFFPSNSTGFTGFASQNASSLMPYRNLFECGFCKEVINDGD